MPKPITLSEHMSRAAKARHAKRTPEERSAYAKKMVAAREAKRAAKKVAAPELFACNPCVPMEPDRAGWIFCARCTGNITGAKDLNSPLGNKS